MANPIGQFLILTKVIVLQTKNLHRQTHRETDRHLISGNCNGSTVTGKSLGPGEIVKLKKIEDRT